LIWITARADVLCHVMAMEEREDRATVLRRRIELYRNYLKRGVDAELAREYLRQIMASEAELQRIARNGTGGQPRPKIDDR
jgi:hypothetical protein